MKINISIDDISPHPYSSIKVLSRCFSLIDEFPDAKFTLFVPSAYWRTVPRPPHVASNTPYSLSSFPTFCEYLKKLPQKNFEIGIHGHFHGIPGKSNNDEFARLSREDAENKFSLIENEISNSGMGDIFKPIFRPPAWRMSPDAIRVARSRGIEVLALSPDDYAKVFYDAEDIGDDIVLYDFAPPFKALKRQEECKIVYHACEWDKNYFSQQLLDELIAFLYNHKDEVEFLFMHDLRSK
tara:strand:- start:4876 stop:5592 length:717 start_codon:yes stop_codon:yes gene_type:complete